MGRGDCSQAGPSEHQAMKGKEDRGAGSKRTWVTAKEAARASSTPLRTIYTWAKAGHIERRQVNGAMEVVLETVLERAAKRRPAHGLHSSGKNDGTKAPARLDVAGNANGTQAEKAAEEPGAPPMKKPVRAAAHRAHTGSSEAIRRETARLQALAELEQERALQARRSRQAADAIRREEEERELASQRAQLEVETQRLELKRCERNMRWEEEDRRRLLREQDVEQSASELARQRREHQLEAEVDWGLWSLRREAERETSVRAERIKKKAREIADLIVDDVAADFDLSKEDRDRLRGEVTVGLGMEQAPESSSESYRRFLDDVSEDIDGFVRATVAAIALDLFGLDLRIPFDVEG